MRIGIKVAFRAFVVAASASGAAAQIQSAETLPPTGDVSITPSYNTLRPPESATMAPTPLVSPLTAQKCTLQEVKTLGPEWCYPMDDR
jgi:hypothetical protein